MVIMETLISRRKGDEVFVDAEVLSGMFIRGLGRFSNIKDATSKTPLKICPDLLRKYPSEDQALSKAEY